MTAETMPPARRRPMPGMTAAASTSPPPQSRTEAEWAGSEHPSSAAEVAAPGVRSRRHARRSAPSSSPTNGGAREAGPAESGSRQRRPAADYATTRLVNFRIPVDLHDRYRQLVREAEQRHPRLRHPSLTELVIALLEEGPATADEAADLIRRKRAAEHGAEVPE